MEGESFSGFVDELYPCTPEIWDGAGLGGGGVERSRGTRELSNAWELFESSGWPEVEDASDLVDGVPGGDQRVRSHLGL
jgi:hypothetical protein